MNDSQLRQRGMRDLQRVVAHLERCSRSKEAAVVKSALKTAAAIHELYSHPSTKKEAASPLARKALSNTILTTLTATARLRRTGSRTLSLLADVAETAFTEALSYQS